MFSPFLRTLIAVCFCFLIHVTLAAYDQAPPIDSLQALLAAEPKLDETRVDRLNQLGYEYWISDPGESIKYGRQALEISRIIPYPAGAAYANRVIGVAHWAQGNLELSFKYLIAARKAYRKLGDATGIANSSLNLGMAYADQRNFDLADGNYQEALRIFKQENKDSRIATTYTKIADLLILRKKYGPAFDFLNRALEIHRKTGFLYGIAEANRKLGQLSAAREAWNEAIAYFLLAVEVGERRNDQVGLAENYLGIGNAYLNKKEYQLAATALEKARSIAEKHGLQGVRRDVYANFKVLEKSKGNFRQALAYAEKYLNVRDSLFNREKSNLIANMEARRAFEAKEEELLLAQKNLELLLKENKISSLTKWLLLLSLLAGLAVAYVMLSRKDGIIARKGADLKKAQRRSDDLASELKGKEQELTSYTLNFVQKNEGITDLKKRTETLSKELDAKHRSTLRSITRKLEELLRVDEDWTNFRRHFESVHPNLINRLGEDFPALTSNDFRLIALIRLNLSTKEISSVLGISPDSVKTARYRLRKKLELEKESGLFEFLLRYSGQVD